MKTLKQIREASGGKEAYQKFFKSILKKFGVDSPAELDDKKKKDFFDAIDKGWDGAGEKAESVKEGKLKGGKGKAEIDINWDGSAKDIKFASTKYKIKIKPHSNGAMISGDKQKILAYLQGQDYAMDDADIEDLYPEAAFALPALAASSAAEKSRGPDPVQGNRAGHTCPIVFLGILQESPAHLYRGGFLACAFRCNHLCHIRR